MIKLPDIRQASVEGKKVFLRLDLDVPFSEFGNFDSFRLEAGFPTLELILKNKGKVIIAGHIGRPVGADEELSTSRIIIWFLSKFKKANEPLPTPKSVDINGISGWKINEEVTILENLRFYKEEEENDLDFAKRLASLADVYVNEAFAASHRAHASIVGVPKYLTHYAGLRLQKEVEELSKVLENPARPLIVIIGGAKIETKLPLIEKMHGLADYVLVGGELARETKALLKVEHEKVPRKSKLIVADLNEAGTDITPKSFVEFLKVIQEAKTIVWNGPMGKISGHPIRGIPSEVGTKEVAQTIVKSLAHTIVGGGDTIGYLKKIGLQDKFSFVSTGGGAMLEFLSGSKLPGLEALLNPKSLA